MKNIKVWNERFAIVKSKKPQEEAFANIQDIEEITSIISEKKLNKKETISVEKGYRLITFNMILPFNMVGFLAKVSSALAEEKIPIFVISSYSTDHILIKSQYLKKALKKLKQLKI